MNDATGSGRDFGLMLVRIGTVLAGAGLLLSFWASPNRLASLPWFLVDLAGVILVLVVTGPLLGVARRKITPTHALWFFLGFGFACLAVTVFLTRWPSYKLAWLNEVYAAIPSLRSLPWPWIQPGLHPNQTGGVLSILTAFAGAVACWPRIRKRTRVPAIVLTFAGALGVFLTGSRAALAGLAVAFMLLLIVRTRRWLWAWGPAVLLVFIGLLASGRVQRAINFFVRDETLDTKLVARLDIWTSAIHGIEDHFFSGIGLGVFNEVMPVRYPYQTVGLSYPVSQAHNLFLDIALGIGVPGAVGFAVVIVGLLIMSIKGSRNDRPAQVVCFGILASTVVYLVFGITDSISLTIPTSFIVWLWVCALAILHLPEVRRHGASVSLRLR